MSVYARGNLRPENALKRAEELGSKHQAFESLSAIAVRKQKVWTKKLEELVLKFITLCVELNRPGKAKDALFAFRVVATQQPQSFENVLRHFILESERQAENAQSGAEDPLFKIVLDPALVNLIKSVSLEEHNRQADSEKLKPWLKFLWEAYRSVLEIIRSTPKLEQLYKAFDYCIKYGRVLEFRRLADLLRNHLLKHNIQYFESEESLAFHLEIRFGQLNTAVALELWQEAYKSIEDINNNLIYPAKVPIPKESLLDYYRQLEKLYWNYMFHAEALLKYNDLMSEIADETLLSLKTGPASAEKDRAIEEFEKKRAADHEVLCSRIVLAALSIPLNEKSEDPFTLTVDNQKEKEDRLAHLLGFEPHPNATFLLNSLVSVLPSCHSNVQAIYHLFEKKTQLFQFAKDVNQALNFLDQSETYKQYKAPIFDSCFIKLLQQLSGVYQTMQIAKLQGLVPNLTHQDIEKRIVLAHRAGTVDCRIDHRHGVLRFNLSGNETEEFKSKLIDVSNNLRKVVQLIHPRTKAEIVAEQKATNQRLASNLQAERKKLLDRQHEIEKIKQQRELRNLQVREAHEAWRKYQEEQQQADLERKQEQRKKEQDEREKQRQQEVLSAQRKAQLVDGLKQIASSTGTTAARKMADQIAVTQVLDQESFVKAQLERLVQERRKHERTLNQVAIRQDHWVRALRELEKPLLEEKVTKQIEDDRSLYLQRVEEEKKEHENRFKQQQAVKQSLLPIMEDWNVFKSKLEKRGEEEYKVKASTREEQIAKWREEKMKALVEEQQKRNAKREQERKREEERRQQQEEARKAQELEAQRRQEVERVPRRGETPPSGGDRPWSRNVSGPGEAPAPGSRPGGEPTDGRPWRRETSEPTASAPEGRPWRRDGPPSAAGTGFGAPPVRQERTWRGDDKPEPSVPQDRAWRGEPASGKPWERKDGGAGPASSGSGAKPWERKGADAGRTDGKPTETGEPTRQWRNEGRTEPSRPAGPGTESSRPAGPGTGGSKPWERRAGDEGGRGDAGRTEGSGGKPWEKRDDGGRGDGGRTEGGGGKPWERRGEESGRGDGGRPGASGGAKPWERRGDDSDRGETRTGGGAPKPWEKEGSAGRGAGGGQRGGRGAGGTGRKPWEKEEGAGSSEPEGWKSQKR